MNGAERVPVTILTGFLGAGKTTLLNRILAEDHGVRIGVMVNDFGAINIDARLVSQSDADAMSLTNGCVCCSMRGDLATTVRRMLDRSPRPQHLIVEASGIADPASLLSAFTTPGISELTVVDAVVCVVDAENARNARLDQVLVQNQIRTADIVVLNKVDLVADEIRDSVSRWIDSLAPRARVITAVNAGVPSAALLWTEGRSAKAPAPVTHKNVGSWTFQSPCPLAYRRLRAALEALPAGLFRVKGIAYLADAPGRPFVVQLVGRRISIEPMAGWSQDEPRTELVFLGTPGTTTEAALCARLVQCVTAAVPLLPPAALRVGHDRSSARRN